jgi:hypothetical protein
MDEEDSGDEEVFVQFATISWRASPHDAEGEDQASRLFR